MSSSRSCKRFPRETKTLASEFFPAAGWSPKQLEGEINRGDWLLHEASPEFVFHKDPYEVWDTLMRTFQKAHQLLPAATDHPEWN